MDRPVCKCGTVMGKNGRRWSGTIKKQIWKCSHCGRARILPIQEIKQLG